MWEAIQSNIRRSRMIIALMGVLLVGLGAVIGVAWLGSAEGALIGAAAALVLWFVLFMVALSGGDRLILASAGAREIQKEDAPVLWNVVEEMTIAAGLGKMPTVHIIDNDSPNAFATGRKPETAAVAVTSGLLRRLDRDELQGVIAHEIAHIKNYDIRFLTTATIMVGAIVIIADVFVRSLWFGGGRRRGGGKGQGQAVFLVLALVMAVLAPLFANLLYYAVSRKREYLADASAARFTRYPVGLASALRKISGAFHDRSKTTRESTARALAPMYIVNPLQASGGSAGLMATHPPIDKRIAVLESMSGAGWIDYENAFRRVVGDGCLSTAVTGAEGSVAARKAGVEPDPKQAAMDRARGVTDLLDRFADLLLIPCACGVRIKVPAGEKRAEIGCPRCGKSHAVPKAEQPAAGAATEDPPQTLTYRRQGKDWDSFECACGKPHQISPAFRSGRIACSKCGRKIRITA